MTPKERDLAIRVMLAEANGQGPNGLAAVAHVIRNRVATGNYGDGLGGVLTKKYAFEPMLHYGTGKNNDPARFKEAEPVYQEAARIFDAVSSGGVADPTKGATHFLAKGLQSDLGRDTPSWAKKPLAQIGGHTFYSPDIDPEHVRAYAETSTPTTSGAGGDAIAEFLNKSPAGGAPASPKGATSMDGNMGQLTALFEGMKRNQQQAQQPNTPLLPRMLFGDQGLNGLLSKIPTPNEGQGFLGGMFGGPTYPQGTSAPSVPAVPGGAPTLPPGLPAPPVAPVQSSPLPPPVDLAASSAPPSGMRTPGWPPPPPNPAAGGSAGATIGNAIKNGIFGGSGTANAASGIAQAAAGPAAAAAGAPAAAAAAPAALSSIMSLFAAI